ncbi:MAG: multiprotein bridging factor aMBF1 [Candidatus Hodarchaeota archaeon]
MPTCEICGRECRSTREISLEGAELFACNRCAELGEPVHRPKPAVGPPSTVLKTRPTSALRPSHRPRPQSRELVAVDNFSQLIRKAREQQGMSQKDVAGKLHERTSIIAKLESGKLTPTISLARKLERLFKLTLLEEAESLDLSPVTSQSSTTLGDVVEIRRKKPPS